jgi:hypothetical protein
MSKAWVEVLVFLVRGPLYLVPSAGLRVLAEWRSPLFVAEASERELRRRGQPWSDRRG